MSSFIICAKEMGLIDERVSTEIGDRRYNYQLDSSAQCAAYGNCGCGVGSSCASSCVSGCAERGSCCSYGPK